jgi:hypothetical protein
MMTMMELDNPNPIPIQSNSIFPNPNCPDACQMKMWYHRKKKKKKAKCVENAVAECRRVLCKIMRNDHVEQQESVKCVWWW